MKDELFNFKKNALMGNLCEEWKDLWRKSERDKADLVRLSLLQQSIPFFATYCHNGKGVSREYLSRNFSDYINGFTIRNADGVEGYTYGLYVDYDYDTDLVVDKDVVHIMWTAGASVIVPETKCPTIYVSNRSDVHLVCEGFNSVRLYLFDKSRVTIEDCSEESDITALRYSDDCSVMRGKYCLSDKIYEHRKELRL